jgi:hypothetical protein
MKLAKARGDSGGGTARQEGSDVSALAEWAA